MRLALGAGSRCSRTAICDVIAEMRAPRRRGRMWAQLMLCGLFGCVGAPRPPVQADRVALSLHLDPDGSLLVDETWLVRTSRTGPATFERDIPGDRTDGFTDVAVAIDRTPLTEGTGPGHVALDRSGGLRVSWTLPDEPGGSHEIRLTYRALGTLELKGVHGRLEWPLLAGAAHADIASVSVDLEIPDRSVLFAPPAITPGGWRVRRAGSHTLATATGITAADWPVTLQAELTADQFTMPVPAWQMTEDRIGELMPAFVSGGLFLLVIGAGAVVMVAAQHTRGKPPTGANGSDVVDPAVDLALARGGRPSTRESPGAAIVGLVDRGVISVDRAGHLSGLAAAVARAPGLGAHEALAIEALSAEGTPALSVDRARAVLVSAAGRITRALGDDLVRVGLVSRDRLAVRRGLYVAGVTVMVLGVACAGLVPIMRPRFGLWPAALPIGVFVDGLMLLAYAPAFSVLTDLGALRAAQARRRLKRVVPGTTLGPEVVQLGVALGLPARVARTLRRQ